MSLSVSTCMLSFVSLLIPSFIIVFIKWYWLTRKWINFLWWYLWWVFGCLSDITCPGTTLFDDDEFKLKCSSLIIYRYHHVISDKCVLMENWVNYYLHRVLNWAFKFSPLWFFVFEIYGTFCYYSSHSPRNGNCCIMQSA